MKSEFNANVDFVVYVEIALYCNINYSRHIFSSSVSGLVVKFVVAIDEPGVRFPPDARKDIFF